MTLAVATAEQPLNSEGLGRERFVGVVFLTFALLGLALVPRGFIGLRPTRLLAGQTNVAY